MISSSSTSSPRLRASKADLIIHARNAANNTRKIIPSIRSNLPFRQKINNKIPAPIAIGNSDFNVAFVIGSGLIIAHTPHTTIKLKILEPITLLIAIALLPCIAAEILTDNSGALVPIATIVKPIIIDGTLNAFAIPELPSTKKSAPLIKRTNPIISHKYIIFLFLFLLSRILFPQF